MESEFIKLDPELLALQQEWSFLERNKQDEFYAKMFAPKFIPFFRKLDLQGAPPLSIKPRYLVSVLGLSWQPICLMAAWINPEKMLIIGTQNSIRKNDATSESPIERIVRLADLPQESVELKIVDEHQEDEIYRNVREFVRKCGGNPNEVAVDPTGGKKSMSVTAALAGFMAGCQLVYVDNRIYHNRLPLAGTEFPRALMNPLDIFGDAEFEKIPSAYKDGHFKEAAKRAGDLAARPSRQRAKAELCEAMCNAFERWNGFEFEQSLSFISKSIHILDHTGHLERWDWSRSLRNELAALEQLMGLICRVCVDYEAEAADQPEFMNRAILLVLNHLSSARRSAKQGKFGIAALLTYSTLEKYVDLLLLTHFGLKDDEPNYGKLTEENIAKYHETGRRIFKGKYVENNLEGQKITLSIGIQLAASLMPEKFPRSIASVNSLMMARNKCEYEHGIVSKPLDERTVVIFRRRCH